MEEYVFVPSGENISNLSRISSEFSLVIEKRICELSEIAFCAARYAHTLIAEGMEIYEVLSLLSDCKDFSEFRVHGDALSDNASRLNSCFSSLSALDKAIFSELFVKFCNKNGDKISEKRFLRGAAVEGERFIYVKNAFSDEAYDVFSADFTDPRVKYAGDFKEAIRTVLNGDSDFCLLPIEEGGARLPSVAQLVFGSDLKISSVTPVFGLDGSADMKYALLSREFSIPPVNADDDRYLELRINSELDTALSEILSVAQYYNIEVYRVNTVGFETNDGKRFYYSIVLRDEGIDFSEFLVYLTTFVDDFTPIGIYNNLE